MCVLWEWFPVRRVVCVVCVVDVVNVVDVVRILRVGSGVVVVGGGAGWCLCY